MLADELHRDETKEKKPRRKKKRGPKIPNELIRLKNADKDTGWMVTWDNP